MAAKTEFRIAAKDDRDYALIVKAAKLIVEQEEKEKQEKEQADRTLRLEGTLTLYSTQIMILAHKLEMSEKYDRSFMTRFSLGKELKRNGTYVPKSERQAIVEEIKKMQKLRQDAFDKYYDKTI